MKLVTKMLCRVMSSSRRLRLLIVWWMFTEFACHHVVLSFSSEIGEYCNVAEKFNASCDSDSVILMKYAFYGRQRGRCVRNMDSQGECGVDVLAITDSRCSGRRRCTISLPDDEMYAMKACREYESHLYASYSCVRVSMITSAARCDDGIPLSGQTGFLASVRQSLTSSQSRPASLRCRWNVTVDVGRIINVTLYDFGVSTRQRLAAADERPRLRLGLSGSECQKYAVVYEKIAGVERPTIVCSGSLRTRIVYLSQSNSVVIETFGGATVDDDDVTGDVKTSRHADDMSRFLLKYQAAGCEDPSLPVGVTFRRDGNRGVMTCNDDDSVVPVRHYVVCKDNRWTGDVPNCSHDVGASDSRDSAWVGETLGIPTTYGLMVVIVLGVVLGVIVGTLMLVPVLAYFKRRDRKLQHRTKDEMTRMYPGAADINVDDYHVEMSGDTPVISKFLPLTSADSSAAIVAHYDTAGRLTDVQPYTSCSGWYPALSTVDPASADTGTACYPSSTGLRLAAPPSGGRWQLRRHADQEHEYELPK